MADFRRASTVSGEFISVGRGFWLIERGQKCIIMGPFVGLLEVCDVDGETQVYSGFRVKYCELIPLRAVRTEKY